MAVTGKSVFDLILKVIVVTAPLWLLPIALCLVSGDNEAKCAYVLFVLAAYWMFEPIPITVTSLMPFVMFPMLGILPSDKLSGIYFADINFLLLGGMTVALAVEETHLHHRIALAVLTRLGSKPHWLLMGFMGVTGFLSLFMSDTATTAMMIPTTIAIVTELVQQQRLHDPDGVDNISFISDHTENGEIEMNTTTKAVEKKAQNTTATITATYESMTTKEKRLNNCFLLAICFSANIGGNGTIIGSPTNLVLLGQLERIFPGTDPGLNFLTWLEMFLPATVIMIFLAWGWLSIYYLVDWSELIQKWKNRKQPKAKIVQKNTKMDHDISDFLKEKYRGLGPMSFGEIYTGVTVLILIILWVTRGPATNVGWNYIFRKGFCSDSIPAILLALPFFLVPKDLASMFKRGNFVNYLMSSHESILQWDKVERSLQWGVLLVMGSGFAIAEGILASGLSGLIGRFLTANLRTVPKVGIAAIVIIVVVFLTEIASNPATASISGPVVLSLAVTLCIHPLYFGLAANLAASFSFMLPVATPPNALVFGTGRVDNRNMMLSGFAMNCICIGIHLLNLSTWSAWVMQLNTYPDWARVDIANGTLSANATHC